MDLFEIHYQLPLNWTAEVIQLEHGYICNLKRVGTPVIV